MARVKVPNSEGDIRLFDGEQTHRYVVKGGEIVVLDAHVAAVLASVAGSELMPEAPAKKEATP